MSNVKKKKISRRSRRTSKRRRKRQMARRAKEHFLLQAATHHQDVKRNISTQPESLNTPPSNVPDPPTSPKQAATNPAARKSKRNMACPIVSQVACPQDQHQVAPEQRVRSEEMQQQRIVDKPVLQWCQVLCRPRRLSLLRFQTQVFLSKS